MAALTPITIKGPFEAIAANGADAAWTAGSTSGDTFVCTGRQILEVWNSHASNAYTCTITSVDDEKGRSEDIGPYTLTAGDFAVFGVGLTNSAGWKNVSTGVITLDVENAAVMWRVLTLPNGYP